MIRKLFSGQINSITIAALLVALSSLVSRFLGIFRDRILAGEFGAGDTLDVYYAAFRIPDLIFNLIVLGALSAGFIPVFTSLLASPLDKVKAALGGEERRAAWVFASQVINLMALFVVVLSVVGIFAAPALMKLITPGFSPDKQALTVSLTRIMFLSPIFLGISSVLGGILQSFKRFFVYSLSPIFYNVGIIIGALYFVPVWGVYGLAFGVVLGAMLHLLVQVPLVLKLGFVYSFTADFRDKYIRKVGIMMVPRTLTLAVSQINLVIITIIASTLVSGSLTIFNLANNLQAFPVGIFGASFAVAAFPTFAALAFERRKLSEHFSRIFRQILFFIIPATVLLFTLRAQMIRVILGTGNFTWEDTILTVDAVGFFAISLFAQAALPLITRVFYARHDAKTPFVIGLISITLNIALSWELSKVCGVAGLALAFSISSILNFIMLWIALRLEMGGLDGKRVVFSALKFAAAAMVAGIAVQGTKLLVWPYIDMTRTLGVFIQGASAGIVGILVYLALCLILKSEEFYAFLDSFKRRLPWRKLTTGDQGEARGI